MLFRSITPEPNRKILAQICDPIETIDLQTTADYIKQCLKRSKIRFALLGRSAAGKSTFINRLRGVQEGQEGFADVGFGNTVEKIKDQ
jgi:ribosome biogenesis GTPase A